LQEVNDEAIQKNQIDWIAAGLKPLALTALFKKPSPSRGRWYGVSRDG
jgi:hypothetical protein